LERDLRGDAIMDLYKKIINKFILILAVTTFIFSTTIISQAAVVDLESVSENNTVSDLTPISSNTNLPSKYSSADLGYCTSVKTQDDNNCWVYSSISTLESFFLKNGFLSASLDLSESHLDNWAVTNENNEGWQRQAGESGYSYIPLGYFTSWSGPYTEDNECTNIGVDSITYLSKSDVSQIKSAIMDSGAVTTSYNSLSSGLSRNLCSFCITKDVSQIEGHSISVVGWDDDYSKSNFTGRYKPNNNGAWLCKNSWGNVNSIGGYLWISYEDYYLFNDTFFGPNYAIKDTQTINSNDHIYQNEEYGATWEFNYIINDDITYFNVFDFSENGNVLDKVSFETKSLGANYSVYYVPLNDNEVPTTNKSKWIELDNGTVDYQGYICCDFTDRIVPEKKAAIAVNIDTSSLNKNLSTDSDEYTYNGIGVSEWLVDSSNQMIFVPHTEKGNCYIECNNAIIDAVNFYSSKLDDEVGGTFVIKAITNDTVPFTLLGDVNLDGNINITDATCIQRYLVNLGLNLNSQQLANADVNSDGKIDVLDVTSIQKSLVN
jgi:C1A family cysteine protease